MLSRFTKLPGVSSLFPSNNPNYSQEIIDSAVSEIKKLGRYSPNNNNNDNDTLQRITRILSLMKKYESSLHIQRVSCHALSNLAMQVSIARWIVQKGGFEIIKKAVLKFETDHKLCWLGSSAIWNLARPPANRGIIGKQGVELMLKMLHLHHHREKVINTSIGALSNLSLNDELKDIIAKEKNIKIILNVLKEYTHSSSSLSVSTSGAGLIANLAVSDDHAVTLVEKGSIKLLLKLLEWNKDQQNIRSDDTLFRNSCAALNNMVTADNFLDCFLENSGVEVIYKFLKTNNIDQYTTLLENCLINIEVDINEETTTFHLCALHERLNIFKQLLTHNPFTDLNKKDSKNMTVLDYSIMSKNIEMIKFLTKCGATKYQSNLLKTITDQDEKQNNNIQNAIQSGIEILQNVHMIHWKVIAESMPHFSTDLCKFMVTYHNNVDMLQAIKQYE